MTSKSSTIKIGLLISNRWFSAITAYFLSLALASRLAKFDVFCVCLEGSPAAKKALALGLKVYVVKDFSLVRLFALRLLISQESPSFLVTFGGPEDFLCRLVSQTPSIRFWGYGLGEVSRLRRTILRLSPKKFILTPSDSLRRQVSGLLSKSSIVESLTLGLDPAKYSPEGSGKENFILIFGRLDPVKGHREFIRFFKGFRDQYPEFSSLRLKIVGEEANLTKGDLEQVAESLGLGCVDVVTERVADVSSLLSSARLGVVCSLGSEAICRVAEEFLLCGTPVFVSDTGSLPDVLCEKDFGDVFSWQREDDMRRKLKSLLDHEISRSKNNESQYSLALGARAHFSLDVMAQKWEEMIKQRYLDI